MTKRVTGKEACDVGYGSASGKNAFRPRSLNGEFDDAIGTMRFDLVLYFGLAESPLYNRASETLPQPNGIQLRLAVRWLGHQIVGCGDLLVSRELECRVSTRRLVNRHMFWPVRPMR